MASKKKKVASERRKPTYGAAVRLARIMHELTSRPYGWSFDRIRRELRITERTLHRYIAAARAGLRDWTGRPLIEVMNRGEHRYLRLAGSSQGVDSSPYQAASLYFTLTFLAFLEGTVLKQGAEDIWEKARATLSPANQTRLNNIERKFFAVPWAPKDYSKEEEKIDLILRALLDSNTIRVQYGAILTKGGEYEFDPYTLVTHRGGLYVIGKRHGSQRPIYLAVERMNKVDFALDKDGSRIRFGYPAGYSPEKQLDGTFGLIDGPATDVELLIKNNETESYLRSRLIHPTQKFLKRGGKTILKMRVNGTTELRNWVLGFGPWIEVLKPAPLRAEVGDLMRNAARLYHS